MHKKIIHRGIKQFLDIPFPEAVQYDHKFFQSTLSNGIRLITEPFSSNLFSLGILLPVGSKHDGGSPGLSYLASQMLLSGTKSKSQSEILGDFHEMGQFSVQSLRDATWFQITGLKENFQSACKLFGEIFTESTFPNEVFTNLKNKATIETEQLMANPKYLLHENLHRIAFPGHPIANFIRGDEESVSRITRAEILEFINSKYLSNHMVISVSGAIDHSSLVAMAEKFFWRLPQASLAKTSTPDFNSTSIFQSTEDPHTHIAIGYPAASFTSPSLHYFTILSNILSLSPGLPSIKTNTLHYLLNVPGFISHSCVVNNYDECGIMVHLLECTPQSAPFVASAVIRTMNQMGKEINLDEVNRGKNLYFSKLLQNESSKIICQNNASMVRAFGKKINKAELAGKVMELSPEQLVGEVSQWVNTIYPVIAVYGAVPDEDIIEKIFQHSE